VPLSWNEIQKRAVEFSREWSFEKRENAESQTFWNEFFKVFGISRRRIATFEEPVKKLNGKHGFIDLFWKGVLLVEHKSRGKDLDKAYSQALGYFDSLKEYELPKFVLVSDFEKFRLHDLDDNKQYEFKLSELKENIHLLGFIAGYTQKKHRDEIPVNIVAAEKMGKLHDDLLNAGFKGHELEVFLMRLLFCLFSDDTGLFEKNIFADYLRDNTKEDGSDLGERLAAIFQTLDKDVDKRQKNIDVLLNEFPYVNGSLFKERLETVHFNSKQRETLLECTGFNWSGISPAIFGSMFQSAMDPIKRRELSAHYTSESNILKVISSLFLDELETELAQIKLIKSEKIKHLKNFQLKIAKLKFFDPACGCGSFLIMTYRELRKLEINILLEAHKTRGFEDDMSSIVSIGQFYGIEKEEFPAKIAETALWLTDHQMNNELSKVCSIQRNSLPLNRTMSIKHDNALTVEWESIVPKKEINFIFGNPPYKGAGDRQKSQQRTEIKNIYPGKTGAGKLNYVAGWLLLASQYIQGTNIKVAFVAINSITKGEQVGILWNTLLNLYNIKINFAHRSFKWKNEARQNAGVHVVIIGFSLNHCSNKFIFDYPDPSGLPQKIKVKRISPYLIERNNTLIMSRTAPICPVPTIRKGNQPTEGGNLIFSDKEKIEVIINEPNVEPYIKRLMGSEELLHDVKLWCLWLVDASPKDLKSLKIVQKRLKLVKALREASTDKATIKRAATPGLFREQNNPASFLAIPTTTSEKRKYLTVKFLDGSIIPNNNLFIMPNADWWHFGIISSTMNRVWAEYVCGRTDNRNRYSKNIGFNNFPWPENVTAKLKGEVEKAAKYVCKIRSNYPNDSLADLYDPVLMPKKLVDAHRELDKFVEKSYQKPTFKDDFDRLELLFDLYEKYTK